MDIDRNVIATIHTRAMTLLEATKDLDASDALSVLKLAAEYAKALVEHSYRQRQKKIEATMQVFGGMAGIPMPTFDGNTIVTETSRIVGQIDPASGEVHPPAPEDARMPVGVTIGIPGRQYSEGPQPDWMQEELKKIEEEK